MFALLRTLVKWQIDLLLSRTNFRELGMLGLDLRSENRRGRSRHIPDRRYSILMPVPIVPAVQWFDRLTMTGSIFRSSWDSSKDALRSRR